jgi:hypothetical protein
MNRAASLLASSLFLLATGISGFSDPIAHEIRPDLRSAKWMWFFSDDSGRAETTTPGLDAFFNPRSVGQDQPTDATVMLAQAKLPSLKEVNLLAADQGGQALVVPTDEWFKPISGNEAIYASVSVNQEAVYGFKDEKPATFSKFSVLITGASGSNPKQIELLAANDSPTGTFRSIGILETVNAKIVKSPYQELSFSETTARYVKIKILASHQWSGVGLGQIRLLGRPLE